MATGRRPPDRRGATLGLRDDRLAVLLAAIAPEGGWSQRELAAVDRIIAKKDTREMDQVSQLAAQRRVMQALATAFQGPAID